MGPQIPSGSDIVEFYGKFVMAPLAGDKQSWEQTWAREVRYSCRQPSQQKHLNL